MCVRRCLVKVYIERDNVLLAILATDEVVDVHRPLFYLRLPVDGLVFLVVTRLDDHWLLTEGQLRHTVMRSREHKVTYGAVAWLCEVGIRVFDASSCQVLCQPLSDGLTLVNGLYLATDYLKVKMLPRAVKVTFGECHVPGFLAPCPLMLTALSCRHTLASLEVEGLILYCHIRCLLN